jgi:hypothetical protein
MCAAIRRRLSVTYIFAVVACANLNTRLPIPDSALEETLVARKPELNINPSLRCEDAAQAVRNPAGVIEGRRQASDRSSRSN